MRNVILLSLTSTALAACGGGTAPQTVGSLPAPASTTPGTTTTGTTTTTAGTFVNPTEAKTYTAIGGVQHYEYYTRNDQQRQRGQLYAGDATSARNSGITVAYNPRDAIFDITISQPAGLVSSGGTRFQDPVHRTDFGGLREPQAGVPRLPDGAQIQYLQAGSSVGTLREQGTSTYLVGNPGYTSSFVTFFYQKPGTSTRYVTFAGYVRNSLDVVTDTEPNSTTTFVRNNYSLDRSVFAYGERTTNSAVPTSGTGTYSGDMLATMVFNPRPDTDINAASYFQWINGTQTTSVNFATAAVTSSFTGTVGAPALDAYTNGIFDMPANSVFTASATGKVDLVGAGGIVGRFGSASFARPGMSNFDVVIAGSSLDAAFFGPNAEELGGGFRIVGGTPDQRIDILGAFTGKK